MATAKKIEYIDNQGLETIIEIYQAYSSPTTFYELCSQDPILTLTFFNEEDTTIKGSDVMINVMIKNVDDHNTILELFESNDWYVKVIKDGDDYWIGKLQTDFYVEEYKNYPYIITLNASDQLGDFKDVQFLMTDFNIPMDYDDPDYSLLDFFGIALNIEGLNSTPSRPLSPRHLRIANGRKITIGESNTFSKIFINPLIFMEDKDEYISIADAIDLVLIPLNMELRQWYGSWWIINKDIMDGTFQLNYDKCDLGWNTISYDFNYTGTYIPIKPYIDDDTQQVKSDAQMEYLQPKKSLKLKSTYIKNENILPFCNRSGSFYSGVDGKPLEFDESGTELRYFGEEYIGTGSAVYLNEYEWSKNAGYLRMDGQTYTNPNTYANMDQWINITLLATKPAWDIVNDYWKIDFDPEPKDWSMHGPISASDRAYTWSNKIWQNYEYYSFVYDKTYGYHPSTDPGIITKLTDDEDFPLELDLFRCGTQDQQGNLLKKCRFSLGNNALDVINHSYTDETFYNGLNKETLEVELKLGLPSYTGDDERYNHYSSFLDTSGEAINTFYSGSYGATLKRHLENYYEGENSGTTHKLTATYKTDNESFTPLHLLVDYESRPYRFFKGELNDQKGIWKNEYIEYKTFDPVIVSTYCFVNNNPYNIYEGFIIKPGEGFINDDDFSVVNGELIIDKGAFNTDYQVNTSTGQLEYVGI